MKKIRIFLFAILLSLTIFSINTQAETEFAQPTYTINATWDETGAYLSDEPVTITLAVDQEYVWIEFQLFQGAPPTDWTRYNGPIQIQRGGNYRIRFRVTNASERVGPETAFNIRLNIPIDEKYPNVIRNGAVINHKNTGQPIQLPIYQEKNNEVRGVWVSTVSNIDISQHNTDEGYKNEIISILNRVQALNMNTVFFQIRSMNDAMYPSELAPYSRYIKGQQGLGLDWDIFRFVLDEGHKRGLEVHGWLNPYRVASIDGHNPGEKANVIANLHEDNFAKKHPEYVLAQSSVGTSTTFILDPGQPAVREYLNNVIEEVLENYPDVDGIHFDDYFYVTTNDDSQTFINNNPTNIASLEDWRRNNVDIMIKSVHDIVEAHNLANNRHVKFGVSPGGIWANKSPSIPEGSNTTGWQSHVSLFADTRKWVKNEWLDYITPQIYWDFTNTSAPFAVLVDWWVDVVSDVDVDLVVGLGYYKYTDNDPWEDENAFIEQLRYISQFPEITGSVTFSYRTFNRSLPAVVSTNERLANYYWTKPVDFGWESDVLFIGADDEETKTLRNELKSVIINVRNYLDFTVNSDEGLTNNQKLVDNFYASDENILAMEEKLNDANNIANARVSKVELITAKQILDAHYNNFKTQVYEGRFDINRDAAAMQLEEALNSVLTVRNLLKDAKGKTAEELPKGEYFADTEILAAIDAVIIEAQEIIADQGSISREIDAVFHRLKEKESDLNNNRFQGQLEVSTEVTVTFNDGTSQNEVILNVTEKVSKPADPTKPNHVFVGWYLEDELYDFNIGVTKDITLIAVYELEDIETLSNTLETTSQVLKERVTRIKVSENKDPKNLRKDHEFVSQETMDKLNKIILDAEKLLENEDATPEEILELLESFEEVEAELETSLVVGEQENDYRSPLIIIISVLGSLAIIGGVTILVLVKRKK